MLKISEEDSVNRKRQKQTPKARLDCRAIARNDGNIWIPAKNMPE